MKHRIRKGFQLFILLMGFPVIGWGQQGITVKIGTFMQPEYLLPTHENIPQWLILAEVNLVPFEVEQHNFDFPFGIIAQSMLPDSPYSYFGNHSFLRGMCLAYMGYRPYVLSPDMVWLLISQGFARHIDANPDIAQKYFPKFNERKTLTLPAGKKALQPNNDDNSWNEIFLPRISEQITSFGNEEIAGLLSADFSTTTPVEKIASELSMAGTVSPNFVPIKLRAKGGIPEITLLGTPADWQIVLEKTRKLGKYDLEWWTGELIPILEKLVETADGKIDKTFWQSILEYRAPEPYSTTSNIEGWILRFFPYHKNGKRDDLTKLSDKTELPDEIVKIDLNFCDDQTGETIPLELWTGFFAIKQDERNFALIPQTGWLIRKKDVNQTGLKQKLSIRESGIMKNITYRDEIKINGFFATGEEMSLRGDMIPDNIYKLKEIKRLELTFARKIIIPDQLASVKIDELILSGAIDQTETEKISRLFPNTELIINNQTIHKP